MSLLITKESSQALIDALEEAGHGPQPYSGRGMYGTECVGVIVDSDYDIWRLAQALALAGIERISPPRTDSMARRIIAYWPRYEWPEEASAIEAPSGGETALAGSTEGESAVGND